MQLRRERPSELLAEAPKAVAANLDRRRWQQQDGEHGARDPRHDVDTSKRQAITKAENTVYAAHRLCDKG
jgi:hypothetical protein